MQAGAPRVRWFAAALSGITLLSTSPCLAGESTFRLSGLRLDLGQARPQHASPAFHLGGSVGIGTFRHPRLETSVNVARWSSEIDRGELGASVRGTVSDLAVGGDVRWHRRVEGNVAPYVVSGLALHVVGADIPGDRSLEDALRGVKLGADLGLGLRLGGPGVGWAIEARRRFADDVGSWALTAGVRLWRGDPHPRPASRGSMVASTATGISASELARLIDAVRLVAEENRALRSEVRDLRAASVTAVPVVAPGPAVPSGVPATPTATTDRSTPVLTSTSLARELDREIARVGIGEVDRLDDAVVVRLGGEVLFPVGSAQLTLEAREALRGIALVLFRHPRLRVTVEGHADATGDRARNLELSDARARVVRDELMRLHLDPDRMLAVGIGPDRPIATNDTVDGRARNRRVELWLTSVSDAGHARENAVR